MIFDVTNDDFKEKVLDKSHQTPVLVDFWAEWCEPCRMLTPVLEKIVHAMNGRVVLAKVNTELAPELAQRYGVRGIPNVKMFIDGNIKTEFQGNLPESQIRTFIEQFLPNELDKIYLEGISLLGDQNATEALEKFQKVLDLQEDHEEAIIGLSKSLIRLGEIKKAQFWLEQVNPQHVRVPFLKDLILLIEQAQQPEIKALATGSEKAPRLYAEGLGLLAQAKFELALESLLESVMADRNFNDDVARKSMLSIFEELGPKHQLTLTFQKKLARCLY